MRIVKRASWGAQPPRGSREVVSWQGKCVLLHHTAHRRPRGRTRRKLIADEKLVMRELQQIAFDRGFSDISYSFVTMPSGRVYEGRGALIKGAHTQGGNPGCKPFYNDHPGISLPGDYTHQGMTRRQRAAVWRLRKHLRSRYGIQTRMVPHRNVFATSCPGDAVVRQYKFTGDERP